MHQSAFKKADLTEVFEPILGETLGIEAKCAHCGCRETTLKSNVVNGQYARGCTARLRHINRCQSCLPIMRVHNVWRPARNAFPSDLGPQPAQQTKSQMIVRPVDTTFVQVNLPRTIV